MRVMRWLTSGAVAVACALSAAVALAQPPVVTPISAPSGGELPGIKWLKVDAPGVGVMLAAVARPEGKGPFPAALVLHGTHGFAREYVQLAQGLARNGVLAVAACWYSGGSGPSREQLSVIACPQGPPMTEALTNAAYKDVDALVQMMRGLPGVRTDQITLFGHSRGGGAALNYIFNGGTVHALVLDSTGFPPSVLERVPQINVPVLMLHGTADVNAPITKVEAARTFEADMRRAGKSIQAVYYEGGQHNDIFSVATQRDDKLRQIGAFLSHH
jgi:dienelactone hydrolase